MANEEQMDTFMHGLCYPFAYCLIYELKKYGYKGYMIELYNRYKFIHMMVKVKNKYIDVSGIYLMDELFPHFYSHYGYNLADIIKYKKTRMPKND